MPSPTPPAGSTEWSEMSVDRKHRSPEPRQGQPWSALSRRSTGERRGRDSTSRGTKPPRRSLRATAVSSDNARARESPQRESVLYAHATGTHSAALGSRRRCATLRGGSERFQPVGEAGLRPASLLLVPASLLVIRVISGGEGFEPPRDLTARCDFRDCTHLAQPCALRPGARHNERQFLRRCRVGAASIR
jgi:hypothetical protein